MRVMLFAIGLILATLASPSAGQSVDIPAIGAPEPILYDVPAFYPLEAMRRREEGVTTVTFSISAAGAAVDCKVTGTSGHAALDAAACDLIASAIYPSELADAPRREQRINWRLPPR